MYSLSIFLKGSDSIDFMIGSSHSLKFMYYPAKVLGLSTIYSLSKDEDKALRSQNELEEFLYEVQKIHDFWKVQDEPVTGFLPNESYLAEFYLVCKKLKTISVSDIESIAIF